MNKLTRTALVFAACAVAALVFDKVYALFGHGVASAWMSNMDTALLCLGTVPYVLLRAFVPDLATRKGYRLFASVHASGIAVFVNGMLLQGILDIAGGTSGLIVWFFAVGAALVGGSVILFVGMLMKRRRIAV